MNPGAATGQPSPTVWATPTPPDFALTVKVIKKSCFGSAGCNITFNIEVQYDGGLTKQGQTWDVTYEVLGGEDEKINTFQLMRAGSEYKTTIRREDFIGTADAAVELVANVTAVSAR